MSATLPRLGCLSLVLAVVACSDDGKAPVTDGAAGPLDSGQQPGPTDTGVPRDTAVPDTAGPADTADTGTWRSVLYPEDWTPESTDPDGLFLHDFSYAGYHNGEIEPADPVEGESFSVLDAGADPSGTTDSCPAIQATIDAAAAAGGGIVVLPAGEYRCEDRLTVSTSNVVIRGEDRTTSFLYFTRADGLTDQSHLTFSGSVSQGEPIALAEDGQSRSHEVRLTDTTGLEVGQDVSVGWTITDEFVEDHGMTGTWVEFNGQWRPFFRRTITGIDTTTHSVTLDVPLRYPALVRDGASLVVETGYLTECGLEDLSVSTVVAWDDAWTLDRTHAVALNDTADCWVRRVSSYASPNGSGTGYHLLSGGISVLESKRVTVSEVSMAAAQNRGGGGNGYLFEVSRSSEILTRDSTGRAGRHNFIQNWDFGTSGCVWLRTVSTEGRALLNSSDAVGTVAYSEYHHSLAMANLVDDSETDDGWQGSNRNFWSSGAGHSVTESVFWNLRGTGDLISFQAGMGYVIGTDGLTVTTDLTEDGLFGKANETEPQDYTEGIDRGAMLLPRSLYEDQLARRLASL